MRFEGKVAIVTGGSSGIGAAIVERLASEGARVMIADIQEPAQTGETIAFIKTDVSSEDQVAAMIQATIDRWRQLDILVNNAGIGAVGTAPQTDPALWDRLFAVNSTSVFLCSRAAIPVMKSGGAIVNTASISGLFGDYGMGIYNATKGAVVNYTKALALECGELGIRVNALCPGLIRTPLAGGALTNPATRDIWMNAIPLGRPGEPGEMASVVAFLASDDASYMTGSIVTADGGITAHTGQPNFLAGARAR